MASAAKHAAAAPGDIRLRGMAEATDTLRCSRQTIYRLARDGDLRLIKIRAKTLVAGVDDLIARQFDAASPAD